MRVLKQTATQITIPARRLRVPKLKSGRNPVLSVVCVAVMLAVLVSRMPFKSMGEVVVVFERIASGKCDSSTLADVDGKILYCIGGLLVGSLTERSGAPAADAGLERSQQQD
jgi:hypothetical protein